MWNRAATLLAAWWASAAWAQSGAAPAANSTTDTSVSGRAADFTGWLADQAPAWGVRVGWALVILVVGLGVVSLVCRWLRAALTRAKAAELTRDFVVKTARVSLTLVVLIVVAGQLGVSVAPLVAGAGIVGLAVGLAIQAPLASLAAGTMLVAYRLFSVGDTVRVAGEVGKVKEITLFATVLVTPDNRRVTIPNQKVLADVVVNYTAGETRRAEVKIPIPRAAPLSRALEIIRECLEKDDRVIREPPPEARVEEVTEGSAVLNGLAWCLPDDVAAVRSATLATLLRRFNEEGIR